MPSQQHAHGADAHVRRWEGCRRTFACRLCLFYHVIEKAVGIAWCGKAVGVRVKIIVNVREHACQYILHAHCLIIECGACHWHKDIDNVIEEERSQHHQCAALKLGVSAEEVEQHHHQYHRIIAGVAHAHQFAHHVRREGLGKIYSGLTAK